MRCQALIVVYDTMSSAVSILISDGHDLALRSADRELSVVERSDRECRRDARPIAADPPISSHVIGKRHSCDVS